MKTHPTLAKKEYENAKVPTLEVKCLGMQELNYIETKSLMNIQEWKKELVITHMEYRINLLFNHLVKRSLQKLHSLYVNIPLVQLLSYKKAVQLTESEIKV